MSRMITPETVLETLKKDLDAGMIDEIYVVSVRKGKPQVYASDNLRHLGLAVRELDSLLISYRTGHVIKEQ